MKKNKQDFSIITSFSVVGNITLELFSGIIVGLVIGYFLDRYFNKSPIFMIIFLFFGFLSGIINVYRYIKKNL